MPVLKSKKKPAPPHPGGEEVGKFALAVHFESAPPARENRSSDQCGSTACRRAPSRKLGPQNGYNKDPKHNKGGGFYCLYFVFSAPADN